MPNNETRGSALDNKPEIVDRQQWCRRALGAALAELRRRPGLGLKFAEPTVSSPMIRNFESGHAYLPLRKARSYARLLTVSRAAASFYVNPEALVLLLVAIQEDEPVQVGAVDWKSLHREFAAEPFADHVQQSIVGELIRRSGDGPIRSNRSNEVENLLASLNPFQLQIVRDVAGKLSDIGSNVVGDSAISHWERTNAGHLRDVRAIVTCMESEFEPEFIDSVSNLLADEKFGLLEYAVVGEWAEVRAVFRDFRDAIGDRLVRARGKPETKIYLDKLRFWAVPREALKDLGEPGPERIRSIWDALYLYKPDSGEDLLVGVFRRARPFGAPLNSVTLRSWGAEHMNEVLPQIHVAHFEALFRALTQRATLCR